ncbi:hypothetical protein R1flu_006585 [Riccia fluitans]|uniref:Uncharacterized protein n=1 Tax=Riccia fluitans TaxID=41844 RepID=A0ABD1YX32_9MARC
MSSRNRSIHSSPSEGGQRQQRPLPPDPSEYSDDCYDCSPTSTMNFSGSPDAVTETTMGEDENLTQLKLEAMTWAAMAKDFAISSLEDRLRKALQIAKAEQAKNQELQSALDQSRRELSDAKADIVRLEGNEERVAKEQGGYAAEVTNFAGERSKLHAERTKQHRLQLLLLEHRIRLMLGDKASTAFKGQQLAQDRRCSQDSYGSWGWQGIENDVLEQKLEKAQEREKSLFEKCSQAEREIEELKRQLTDAKVDFRLSEVLRKSQSRRLRVLERERRYMLRNSKGGVLRMVKPLPSPRSKRVGESTTPGGPGWTVFSIVDFSELKLVKAYADIKLQLLEKPGVMYGTGQSAND